MPSSGARSPLATLRSVCKTPSDAVRWACILEATAPKAGNVHPTRSFTDLRYEDFVLAACLTAEALTAEALNHHKRVGSHTTFGPWVSGAAKSVKHQIGTNVNLGILLLLGPLVQCDCDLQNSGTSITITSLKQSIESVLHNVTADDSALIFAMIQDAAPSGMGESESMDLNRTNANDVSDIVAAMKLAADRDRIAKQYASAYVDFFENVVPVLDDSILFTGDTLSGIVNAHLRLLATEPDTLIERKHGKEVATGVQRLAAAVDSDDPDQVNEFDHFLRGGHPDLPVKCNPGTTADLIAAALYVLLRVDQT